MLTEAELVKRMADAGAAASDRWLFVALLCVFIISFGIIARYVASRHEALVREYREDNQAHARALAEITREAHQTHTALAVALDRNSSALQEASKAISYYQRRNGLG